MRLPLPIIASTCEICRTRCPGMLPLCPGCERQLPWITNGCDSCGEPLADLHPHHQTLHQDQIEHSAVLTGSAHEPTPAQMPKRWCHRCAENPLPFSKVVIPLQYKYPLDLWIGTFKYRQMPGMASWLAQLLIREIRQQRILLPDNIYVTGIPSHPTRQRERGYNQSQLLAKQVAKAFDLTFRPSLAKKTRTTATQRTLNAAMRRLNLQDAFTITSPLSGSASTAPIIILVDDVVTTGATSAELAQSFLNAGAKSVQLWALAKTPLHMQQR